ncbi:helix-turn-helix domain-containing protein [Roseisolibacter agri]|uniref:DNA-binding response regulator n=1 Tax=Roseisolibacter agri TaxID=2014610 RepID=A0AA37Q8F3_9BACT|nr:response regulator transcription factor [Roseisolibacter agri]GLC25637.1 DNA-binding response regulator [Roseisolibacter agri]
MPTVRVVILAGSPVVRAGLESLLGERPGLVVVGAGAVGAESEGVEAAFDRVAEWDADVVLWVLDAGMREPVASLLRRAGVVPAAPPAGDDGDGAEFLPSGAPEREGAAAPAVVLLVDRGDPGPSALAALRAGARAVLPADVGAATLALVTESAAAGLTTLPADAAHALLAAPPEAGDARVRVAGAARVATPDGAPARAPALSAREREVLALLAEGLPNKVIGPRLGISEHTVKAHVAAIFEKLGTGTRAEAVVTAARLGLLLL